ncbi:MAG: RNA polymerase sigma factor [Candidatus Promineifilaceae bacterium]
MGESNSFQSLQLNKLAENCAEQSQRYRDLGADNADPRYCYELFRRAIVEGDESAWAHLYQTYESQVIRWARQCGNYHATGQDAEYFVSIIYTKFWRAMSPEHFVENLPALGSVLAYLKRCVQTTLIDYTRSRRRDQMLDELGELERVQVDSADIRPIERKTGRDFDRKQLWQQIGTLLKSDQERIVMEEIFLLNKKANHIFTDHPSLFKDVNTVYRVKENLLKRLRRNSDLAEWRNRIR